MGVAFADLSQDYRDWAAADIPMIVGDNVLRDLTGIRWRTGEVGWGGSSEADADGPETYLYDEYDDLQSFPDDASPGTGYSLVVSTTGTPSTFDTFAMLNCTGMGGVTVRFDISDVASFSSYQTMCTTALGASFSGRHAELVMTSDTNAQSSSGVLYFRAYMSKGSSFTPKIGEVVVGSRTQLNHHPKIGYDKNRLTGSIARFESSSGIMSDYVFHKGRRRIAATYSAHEDARISDIETLFETRTDFGTLPFCWWEDPDASPTEFNWMRFENPDLVGPVIGYTEREFMINAIEHGPNFLKPEII
jgi:hypothetical protein